MFLPSLPLFLSLDYYRPSLRILDLSSNELHSLNGLGQCYALERLNLDKNHLNTLSLTAVLPRLTHLYLSFNPTLNHLDLSLLPALERLRVDGNDLWRLSGLSKSSKLRSLSCRGQEGGMLRLGPLSLPRIRSLYLSGKEGGRRGGHSYELSSHTLR